MNHATLYSMLFRTKNVSAVLLKIAFWLFLVQFGLAAAFAYMANAFGSTAGLEHYGAYAKPAAWLAVIVVARWALPKALDALMKHVAAAARAR